MHAEPHRSQDREAGVADQCETGVNRGIQRDRRTETGRATA
jgi:hypothetical protein